MALDAATLLSLLVQRDATLMLPRQASKAAPGVDWLFYFIFYLSLFFFLAIVIVMVIFALRYRQRREGEKPTASPAHSLALELTWTIIPTLLVLVIFGVGFRHYLAMTVAPRNALEIYVIGQKWNWLFRYPDGTLSSELHAPVNYPVRLIITSEDVIHSVFIPAFRLKKDAVPGRYNKAWFEATEPGEFALYCTEYCGTSHSDMIARVVIHEPGGFEKWLEEASDIFRDRTLPEVGEYLFKTRGCAQCHSVDGSYGTGPSLKGVFGYTHTLTDGSSIEAEENYLRESILFPQAKVVSGYQPVMPTYKGKLKDSEITALVEYIKSLSDRGAPRLTLEEAGESGAAAGESGAQAPAPPADSPEGS